jgi:hypothetical protein
MQRDGQARMMYCTENQAWDLAVSKKEGRAVCTVYQAGDNAAVTSLYMGGGAGCGRCELTSIINYDGTICH